MIYYIKAAWKKEIQYITEYHTFKSKILSQRKKYLQKCKNLLNVFLIRQITQEKHFYNSSFQSKKGYSLSKNHLLDHLIQDNISYQYILIYLLNGFPRIRKIYIS